MRPEIFTSARPCKAVGASDSIVDLKSGQERPAAPAEAALLPPDAMGSMTHDFRAEDGKGRSARTANQSANPFSPHVLIVTTRGGKTMTCNADACRGSFTSLMWQPKSGALFFEKREGWDKGDMAIYRWTPGQGSPALVIRTEDVVSNCTPADSLLVCLREGSTQPARIVAIDPQTGHERLVYDPNPEFQAIRFGKVERLEWRNDRGLEVRGDLVLPPGYMPGTRLPLIVTTYTSNGFLRGATGDEFPIHVFAARGFAVLSYNSPPGVWASAKKAADYISAVSSGMRDWSERFSIQSAVMTGVQKVIDMGIADPARIGIAGLSDGSSTAEFAMIHSDRFAAASIGTCCLEPWSVSATYGPAVARIFHSIGWTPATSSDQSFWDVGSLIRNAAKIDTPLLMQLSDHEYLAGIDTYAALREQGKPVDLYVFDDEYHIKSQPAHRLAVYNRNLDWFAFWLQGRIDPDPAKADQYAQWEDLRRTWRKVGAK